MAERGFKRGLVSRVKNKHSGKWYIISTAREIGKDYWTTVIFPAFFFGLFPKFSNPLLTWVRNTEKEAYEVHWEVKKMVMEEPEGKWVKLAPFPEPPDGYSKDAEEVLRKKLGLEK